MKRHGNLWHKICNIEALRLAHAAAKRGKSYYREVKWVDANENAAIEAIYLSLANKTYTTSPYEVEERFDGRKIRTIHKLPYYPDRIVQHALVSACEHVWFNSFIRDTFQSIVGRGTHDARKRVRSAVCGNPELYALKFDIKKYYPSVNSSLMKVKIRKTIKCSDTLWLLDNIIDSCDGLPIGNYTSQYLGNIYLNDFDWWVKQSLRPKHYFRYCDDIVVLGASAEECHSHRAAMFEKLLCEYHLSVKKDWQVFPVDDRGLDFVGFVFKSRNMKLRKGIASGVRRKAQQIRTNASQLTPHQIANGAGSYWGWCKHGGGKSLWSKHMTADVCHAIRKAKSQIKEAKRCK
jgi:RNA-directed DNA polymerase